MNPSPPTFYLWFIVFLLPTIFYGQRNAALTDQLILKNVHLVDIEKGRVSSRLMNVYVKGEEIEKITKYSPTAILPSEIPIYDGEEGYLLPGLWDMHAHPDDPEVWRMKPTQAEKDKLLSLFVAYGVTGIRDMAGDLELANSWKKRIVEGTLIGPEIYAAGPLLDGPNPMWDGSVGINNEQHVPVIVDSLIAAGIDFLKVYSLLPRDIYFALNEYANTIDFPIVGHVPMTVRPSEASAAGLWCQEHLLEILPECSSQEDAFYNKTIDYGKATSRLDQYIFRNQLLLDTYEPKKAKKLYRLFAKNKTWHTPTLSMWYKNAYYEQEWPKDEKLTTQLPKYLRKYWTPAVNDHLRNRVPALLQLKQNQVAMYLQMTYEMHKAGVPLLAGTDVGANPLCHPGLGVYNELALMVEAGLSPVEALKTATINPALFLGIQEKNGSIKAGKFANMLLTKGNPLKDINNLHTIRMVINKGKVFTQADREKLLEEVKDFFDKIDYE